MPNLLTASVLVDMAAKCLAMAASSLAAGQEPAARAEWALVMVSWVVKVLEATRNRVVSGFDRFERFHQVGAVHVGDEMGAQVGPGIGL